jgi:NAD(P)-dependent dehydrogenase (short-subunit alcohol dehydrogenase family)
VIELDVASESAWDDVLAEVGPIDGLVTSAGIRRGSSIVDTSLDEWRRHLDVNVTGTWLAIRSFLRRRLGRRARWCDRHDLVGQRHDRRARSGPLRRVEGRRRRPQPGRGVGRGPLGVRVNSIAPGPICTPMTADRLADVAQVRWLTGRVPGRVGEADEIATTAAFLLSDAASYITGEITYVDGGWAANAV